MRVNVDDIAFMDPRFKKLGQRCGMTWQEALGRCLPVWALAYSQRSPVVTRDDVDALAEKSGFADAMVAVDLAADHDPGVWVRGVSERIDFLILQDAKRERANEARRAALGLPGERPRGPSRGKSRGKKSSSESDVFPGDLPGGPSPGNIPREIPGDIPAGLPYSHTLTLTHTPDPARVPGEPTPSPEHPEERERSAEVQDLERKVDRATAVNGGRTVKAEVDEQLVRRQRLRVQTFDRMIQIRNRVAADLGLGASHVHPHDAIGERDLSQRIVESGEHAEIRCEHILAVAEARARGAHSVAGLTGSLFTEKNWRFHIGMTIADAKRLGERESARSGSNGETPAPRLRAGALGDDS